jgi:adenylate cyclase
MARQQWISGNFGDPRRDEAIVRICQQATALDPDYAEAWALMALAQAELRFVHGKNENARPAAERALELNPSLPEAHCIKARYLEEEGQAEEAEKQIRTALKLNPESWEVNREAARMLFRHNHVREAIPFFEKAVSLMDSDYHNSMMLLTCYSSIDDKAGVEKAGKLTMERAESALARDPTNGQALAAGAHTLLMFAEGDRAREWIKRGLLLDPDNLVMRYNLGCTLAQFGSSEQALDTLESFFERVNSTTHMRHIEVDPDLDPIRADPRFQAMLAAAKQRLGVAG